MASKSFSELVKSRRSKGGSIAGSLSYGIKERIKEKIDPRRFFNQKGILTALFPSLRAYQAGGGKSGETLNSPDSLSAGFSTLQPFLEQINQNSAVIAKNSVVLPKILRDVNVMQKNMAKLVKMKGGTPAISADRRFFLSSSERNKAYEAQIQKEKVIPKDLKEPEEEDKSFLQTLFEGILKGITALGASIISAFASITGPLAKVFNIKELAEKIIAKETFKSMLSTLLGAIVRPLLPILIAYAVAEYFKFNPISQSLDKNQQKSNYEQIPGLGAPNEKGERMAESGKIRNKELSTSTMVGKYNKDTVQGIVDGNYQVVEVFLPGTNQREYLPLLTHEAQDLKDNYNNLYVALNQLDKLSKEKGGASHEKIAQFVAMRDKSEKNIYEMWQKNLKGRFKNPPEELVEHIENKLKYPNLTHFEGKIKAMQDSMMDALTGRKDKSLEPQNPSSPAPSSTVPSSGPKIDSSSKELKTSQNEPSTPNEKPITVAVNNNSTVQNQNSTPIQKITSVYDFEATQKFGLFNQFMVT